MDLDSRAYSKLIELYYKDVNSGEYTRIVGVILSLAERHDYETPEIVCDSLIFTSTNGRFEDCYRYNHLKRCISENTISNEHIRINEILQSIDKEAKLERLHLELFSQSTSHSKKDKLASISYDYDTCTILYKAYAQAKATIAENTMPSASNFEPACISPISAKQNNLLPSTKGTVLKLRDGTKVTIV
ncbi:hypothetical protein RhiirC2_796865 [Rhizophagus irregularis]|uniref:Uncharacterized protein n=1 Tax=Rhizophagus irregularis TaxID=588596 RepID=A0A2N1M900_9GLOM|nr:hypothetical protein RhiirC2_796865 [Rhizophagus irregularis]